MEKWSRASRGWQNKDEEDPELLGWDKGWDRAVEGIGNGAEHFGFHFLDKAIGGDGLGAGVEEVLLDLRRGLGKAV